MPRQTKRYTKSAAKKAVLAKKTSEKPIICTECSNEHKPHIGLFPDVCLSCIVMKRCVACRELCAIATCFDCGSRICAGCSLIRGLNVCPGCVASKGVTIESPNESPVGFMPVRSLHRSGSFFLVKA